MLTTKFSRVLLVLVAGGGCHAALSEGARLPADLELREETPSTYEFICDYFALDTRGNLQNKQRVHANYTRALPGGKVTWTDVTVAPTNKFEDPFPSGERQEFMDGFSYSYPKLGDEVKPGFFQGFPEASPVVPMLKNLVWDTHMLERFAQDHFDKLELNQPFQVASGEVSLAGAGTFNNKQVDLTWVGTSKMNGEPCALLRYRAFFNTFEMPFTNGRIIGRSHYWGEIFVSLADKQVEYATLYEDVLLEVPVPEQSTGQLVNVFRVGTFQKTAATGK